MSSKTAIGNLAMRHLGASSVIANLDTENSPEASAIRSFYELARDSTLRAFPWPFANQRQPLGLVEEDPNTDWLFSYRYPADCLKIIRIPSGIRQETEGNLIGLGFSSVNPPNVFRQDVIGSRVKYKVASDSAGQLIYTDKEDAELEFTSNAISEEKYPPDFVLALSLRIAAYIAPTITAGDPFKLGPRALQMFFLEIARAQESGASEDQPDTNLPSSFETARL